MRSKAPLLLIPLVLVLSALVALAQPKKTSKAATDSADAGAAGAAASESDDESDIGGPPPKSVARDGGPRPSPLNPRANEFPDGATAPPPPDYDRLLGDIASLRSRVAALTTTLFASKLRVVVEIDDNDAARISSFSVTLDDGVVFTAPERFSATEERVVYEHAVAPGHHVIGVEIERYDSRGKMYKTWQLSKFSVVVPENEQLEARVLLEDDSDMAEDFPDDEDGEYELSVRLRAQVIE